MSQIIFIQYENSKYPVIISEGADEIEKKYGALHIKCEAANIDQSIMPEDILGFLSNMTDFIRIWKEAKAELEDEKKENKLVLRLSKKDKLEIGRLAKESGYKNISSYVRERSLQV